VGPTASLHALPLSEFKPLLANYPACSGRYAETAVQYPPVQKESLGII